MNRRPPIFTRPDTLLPYTTLSRSHGLLPHIIIGYWRDLDFHATVLRFAFFGRIAGDGLSLAKAPGGNPRRLNPIHAEVIGNGLGAAFAQRLVVPVGAGAVGMAVNVDIGARIILQHFGYVIQPWPELRLNGGLVGGEDR